jgi:hypothetical protein
MPPSTVRLIGGSPTDLDRVAGSLRAHVHLQVERKALGSIYNPGFDMMDPRPVSLGHHQERLAEADVANPARRLLLRNRTTRRELLLDISSSNVESKMEFGNRPQGRNPRAKFKTQSVWKRSQHYIDIPNSAYDLSGPRPATAPVRLCFPSAHEGISH